MSRRRPNTGDPEKTGRPPLEQGSSGYIQPRSRASSSSKPDRRSRSPQSSARALK